MNKRKLKKLKNQFLTATFYSSIGIIAALSLFLLFYWSLRLNSSIYNLVNNTKNEPLYLWSYILLTLGTVILFGVNASIFTYRWRKFGPPRLKSQSSSGLGALAGLAASACPVCGSVLLSTIGIAGGLAVFPLQGLELKVLSFGLMAFPFWLTVKEVKQFDGGAGNCPLPKEASIETKDLSMLVSLTLLAILLSFQTWDMLSSDPIVYGFLSFTR